MIEIAFTLAYKNVRAVFFVHLHFLNQIQYLWMLLYMQNGLKKPPRQPA